MSTLRELMTLEGRVACITGGAGHIGFAAAETLAELGASVVVIDLDATRCADACETLHARWNTPALPLPLDLESERAIRSVPAAVLQRFGRLDVLINCAALGGATPLEGWAVPILEQSPATWRRALEINLTAPFVLTQACAQALAESEHGSVINVASIYGLVGPNMSLYDDTTMGNPAAYGASKGGLLQLTRYLATMLAPRVRVNAISPGGVWRDQPEAFHNRYRALTPLGRMATEDDLKGAVAYLATDLSAYVTGQNVVVDGGWTAW